MVDCIKVTLVNRVPNSVTVSTGVSGGGTWGTISGTITDQSDLVTYVADEIASIPTPVVPTLDSVTTQGAITTNTIEVGGILVPSIEMTSTGGSTFTVLMSDLGQLLVFSGIPNAPFIDGLPTISGDVEVGRTLTATPAVVTGDPTPVTTWQWQRKEVGGDWANIVGATTDSYLITFDDFGDFLRVRQTATNIIGLASSTSAETTAVAGNIIEITYIDPLKARMDVFEGEVCALASLTALDNIDIV